MKPGSDEGTGHILVIDDDQPVRDLIRHWLEREGYSVQVAANGREGIALQRLNPAEVVICDLIMPEQEGLETISQLRKEFPDVRIIAISGGGRNSPLNYLDVARHLGARQVFTKPLNMRDLVATVNTWQR